MNFIYDRTPADARNARIARDKISKGEELTEKDILALTKGSLFLQGINRISKNLSEVALELAEMGYYTQRDISVVEYSQDDVFFQEDLERFCDLASALKRAFFTYANTPRSPFARYNYNELNNIEKITKDMSDKADEVRGLYRECGNYICGEG